MDQLLSSERVREILNISATTLWRRVRRGEIPVPRKACLGGRNYWLQSEIASVISALPKADIYTRSSQSEPIDSLGLRDDQKPQTAKTAT